MDCKDEISLCVPGSREYALVIRTALGGVAILKELDVDTMDDLRTAADEACDCLLHQGRRVETLTLHVRDAADKLVISLDAAYMDEVRGACETDMELSRAVLETLIPEVELSLTPCGCVKRIDMTLPKAAV